MTISKHCFRLMSNKNIGHAVTFQKLPNSSSVQQMAAELRVWSIQTSCQTRSPMSTHNTWKCNQADCLKLPLKWILNMLVYISQVCFRAPQQVSPRSIQSPLTLEGKYGIKEWFKGTAHWKQKCDFVSCFFTKFYLLSQASIILFLIFVVILSFRPTANGSTTFFGH